MNVGELKFNNFAFNSQTQLNNDWFGQQGKTESFDDVLKSKKTSFSKKTSGESKVDFTKSTKDRSVGVGFDQEARVDFGARRSEDVDLKDAIREGVAQKKFQKENPQSKKVKAEPKELLKKTVEDELEELEAMLNEALGLEQDLDKPDLQALATSLGVSLEAVTAAFEKMTSQEADTGPMLELFKNLSEENVMAFVGSAKNHMAALPLETQEAFAQLLEPMLENVENPEVKAALESLILVEQSDQHLAFDTTEKMPEVMASSDVSQSQDKENVKVDLGLATEKISEAVEEAKPLKVEAKAEVEKTEIPVEGKSMVTEVVKSKGPVTTKATSFEEQVNLMKSEASVISSSKGEVKVPLARHVMNQVIQGTKMSVQMTDQGSEMLVKLNPKNLGNVALKMAFDKGTLMAEIQVENQTVKSIIESNLDQLRSSLKEEGYDIGELDVSVNKENTGQEERSFSQSFQQQESKETFEDEQEKILTELKVNNKEIDYFA